MRSCRRMCAIGLRLIFKNADIQERLGRSTRSFEAFLLLDLLEGVAGDLLLPSASITREVLQSLGLDYQELVDRVD